MRAPNVVLYFWSARDKRSIKNAERMDLVFDEFHSHGVEVIGIASAASRSQLREVAHQNEAGWPQILDSGDIASHYHVDPANSYLVLDQRRNVIAAVSSPMQVASVLGPLTKHRRSQ